MKNIALIGFAATFKTSAGRRLAQMTGRAFWDTDAAAEALTGMEVGEIFKVYGEKYFRRAEKIAVSYVEKLRGAVISTGGGTPLDDGNMSLIAANSVIVLLTASPEIISMRLSGGKVRPLFDGMNIETLALHILEREKVYRRWAHFSLCTDALTSEETVLRIREMTGI